MARCNVNTQTRKPRGQPFIGALSPLDDVPSSRPQSEGEVLDRDCIGRGAVPFLRCPARLLAWLPDHRLRLNAGHIALSKLSNARAQLGIVAVAGVHQRHVAGKADLTSPADLFERNLRLGFESDLLGHPHLCAAIIILGPCLRKIQPIRHRQARIAISERQRHGHLAVRLLAKLPAVLVRHTNREYRCHR